MEKGCWWGERLRAKGGGRRSLPHISWSARKKNMNLCACLSEERGHGKGAGAHATLLSVVRYTIVFGGFISLHETTMTFAHMLVEMMKTLFSKMGRVQRMCEGDRC